MEGERASREASTGFDLPVDPVCLEESKESFRVLFHEIRLSPSFVGQHNRHSRKRRQADCHHLQRGEESRSFTAVSPWAYEAVTIEKDPFLLLKSAQRFFDCEWVPLRTTGYAIELWVQPDAPSANAYKLFVDNRLRQRPRGKKGLTSSPVQIPGPPSCKTV
jgi:hypothetical protein